MPAIECGNPQPEIELRRVGRLADDDMGVGLDAHISQNRWIRARIAIPGLHHPTDLLPGAALPAVRQRCRHFRFGYGGILVWLAHFVADQPIYLRLHHLRVFSSQLIQLMVLAQISPVEFEVGDGLLHSAIPKGCAQSCASSAVGRTTGRKKKSQY